MLEAIKDEGPISKRDLQKLTGLSWGAVSSLTGILYDHGYVTAVGKQMTSIGRKPSELDINPDNHLIVGIDLNLSGLCGIVSDLKGRIVREWLRLFTRKDYDCVMETLLSLIDDIFAAFPEKHLLGIGLAVQGFVDAERGVSVYLPHVKNWKDVPLREILEERYHCFAVLMHDPDCIMQAEKTFGDSFMSIAKDAILLRLDKGIGMAMMADGAPYLGANGRAGELGHVLVNPEGPLCACGNRGCLSEYASGSGLVRRFVEQVNRGQETTVDFGNLEALNYKILAAAAQNGDRLCRELFEQLGAYLGQGVSMLFNVLNPDLVVLYGDLTAYRGLFAAAMEEHLSRHVYEGIPSKVVFSNLGRNAAAQGAALVAAEQQLAMLDLLGEMPAAPELAGKLA